MAELESYAEGVRLYTSTVPRTAGDGSLRIVSKRPNGDAMVTAEALASLGSLAHAPLKEANDAKTLHRSRKASLSIPMDGGGGAATPMEDLKIRQGPRGSVVSTGVSSTVARRRETQRDDAVFLQQAKHARRAIGSSSAAVELSTEITPPTHSSRRTEQFIERVLGMRTMNATRVLSPGATHYGGSPYAQVVRGSEALVADRQRRVQLRELQHTLEAAMVVANAEEQRVRSEEETARFLQERERRELVAAGLARDPTAPHFSLERPTTQDELPPTPPPTTTTSAGLNHVALIRAAQRAVELGSSQNAPTEAAPSNGQLLLAARQAAQSVDAEERVTAHTEAKPHLRRKKGRRRKEGKPASSRGLPRHTELVLRTGRLSPLRMTVETSNGGGSPVAKETSFMSDHHFSPPSEEDGTDHNNNSNNTAGKGVPDRRTSPATLQELQASLGSSGGQEDLNHHHRGGQLASVARPATTLANFHRQPLVPLVELPRRMQVPEQPTQPFRPLRPLDAANLSPPSNHPEESSDGTDLHGMLRQIETEGLHRIRPVNATMQTVSALHIYGSSAPRSAGLRELRPVLERVVVPQPRKTQASRIELSPEELRRIDREVAAAAARRKGLIGPQRRSAATPPPRPLSNNADATTTRDTAAAPSVQPRREGKAETPAPATSANHTRSHEEEKQPTSSTDTPAEKNVASDSPPPRGRGGGQTSEPELTSSFTKPAPAGGEGSGGPLTTGGETAGDHQSSSLPVIPSSTNNGTGGGGRHYKHGEPCDNNMASSSSLSSPMAEEAQQQQQQGEEPDDASAHSDDRRPNERRRTTSEPPPPDSGGLLGLQPRSSLEMESSTTTSSCAPQQQQQQQQQSVPQDPKRLRTPVNSGGDGGAADATVTTTEGGSVSQQLTPSVSPPGLAETRIIPVGVRASDLESSTTSSCASSADDGDFEADSTTSAGETTSALQPVASGSEDTSRSPMAGARRTPRTVDGPPPEVSEEALALRAMLDARRNHLSRGGDGSAGDRNPLTTSAGDGDEATEVAPGGSSTSPTSRPSGRRRGEPTVANGNGLPPPQSSAEWFNTLQRQQQQQDSDKGVVGDPEVDDPYGDDGFESVDPAGYSPSSVPGGRPMAATTTSTVSRSSGASGQLCGGFAEDGEFDGPSVRRRRHRRGDRSSRHRSAGSSKPRDEPEQHDAENDEM